MSDKQKTAVQWLRENYHKVPQSQFGNLFSIAQAMEREQIAKSVQWCLNGVMDDESALIGR